MSPTYEVEMHGDVREVYIVEAETEDDARGRWADGRLVLSEASGMDFYSVREEQE